MKSGSGKENVGLPKLRCYGFLFCVNKTYAISYFFLLNSVFFLYNLIIFQCDVYVLVQLGTSHKYEHLHIRNLTIFYFSKHITAAAKSLHSCPTLCNPVDGSPPGSPIPRILQARTLEWVAISFSNA